MNDDPDKKTDWPAVICPECSRVWPNNCEQSDAIKTAGKCIVCRESPGNEPRCPDCGYTVEDAKLHGDHHLCSGAVPGPHGAIIIEPTDEP